MNFQMINKLMAALYYVTFVAICQPADDAYSDSMHELEIIFVAISLVSGYTCTISI